MRELCDRYGIVFIADEVMAGFGRTGKWFAVEHFDVTPDLLTFAKGVNSGYVPLGGVAISPAIADTFAHRAYPGGLTYSGHPLAMRGRRRHHQRDGGRGHRRQRRPHRRRGARTRPSADIAGRHPSVGEVRGLGCVLGGRAGRRPTDPRAAGPLRRSSSPAMNAAIAACKTAGLLPFANFNRIHVVPPCTVSEAEARQGLAILDDALDTADAYL